MTRSIDILDRQPFVEDLIKVVRLMADGHNCCTFAIDGRWGSGKTYILSLFEEQLNLFQHPDAAGDRYILFHYNCWQYDYYDEPAVAIIASIRDKMLEYKKLFAIMPNEIKAVFEIAKDLGSELLGNVLETKLGWNPLDIWDKFKDNLSGIEDATDKSMQYDSYFSFKSILDKTKQQLSDMAKDKPIIIVVDELDRCIPEYSIKVLERLHHLFDGQQNIIVILTIDVCQLSCAIRNIYGIEEKSVPQFLKKFINFTLTLDTGALSSAFWDKYKDYLSCFEVSDNEDSNLLSQLPLSLFKGIDVRTQERIMDKILTLHRLSFEELSDLSVLYFELIHQVLTYKCGSGIEKWIINISKNPLAGVKSSLGEDLFQYISELEKSIDVGHVINMGPPSGEFIKIQDKPLSLAFWYLATLNGKIDRGTCKIYSFDNASNYEDIVDNIKKFNELSHIIN